jgi:teichuronic acid biosynthesis glycosyltransferase TuaC
MSTAASCKRSSEKLRVMVLTRMWPTPDRPHDGTFVKDEVDALRRYGVECHVIAEGGPGGLGTYIRLWRRMRRALGERHYDAVHAHYGTTGWVGRLQTAAPLVVTFHGSDLMGGRLTDKSRESIMGYVEMALGWALARVAASSIVVSPTMLARAPVGRTTVIAAGVDLTRFRPGDRNEAREALGIEHDHPIVLFVADPGLRNKNYDLASDAAEIARRALPDLKLVTVAGRPHEELPYWMNAADALVLTSKVEGSPMVIKEALACNLPIVSVDVGDVAQRVDGVPGCRLVARMPEVIASGLIDVIDGSECCGGRESMADVSSDASAGKVLDVYRSVKAGRPVRRSRGACATGCQSARGNNVARPAQRASRALAGFSGLAAHRTAAMVRRLARGTRDAQPANLAVLCDGFLRYATAQAMGLRLTGLNVTLYYVDRLDEFAGNDEERKQLLARARRAGVALVPLPRRRIRSLLKHTVWLHRDLRRRKIATAVVQSHIDPRYATLGFGLRVVVIVHDPKVHTGDELSTFALPVRLVSRMAELTSSCLIVHSERLFDQIRPCLRRLPLGVVPHGTDMSAAPAPIPDERRLLIFGRLFEYKGVDTALEAFRSLPEHMADTKLIVAGCGPLAALARGRRNVEVREEYIADADIGVLLRDARLVLLPYKDATQSGVGMQAVARGVPCVVSCVGGLPELVEDSSPSLVVPPGNPKRLAEAIVAHLDHDEGLRSAIYDHAANHFAWPVVARQLRSELRRLGLDVGPSAMVPEPRGWSEVAS